MQPEHLSRRQFLFLIGTGLAATLAGCKTSDIVGPTNEKKGAIKNGTKYTLCTIKIDGVEAMNTLEPGETRICPIRPTSGVKHSFYAAAADPDVYHTSPDHAIDDIDGNLSLGGFTDLDWTWVVGGTLTG